MTREQALNAGRKRWGKRAYMTVGQRQSSPERRDEASELAARARAERDEIQAEIKRREEAAGIPELLERMKALGRTAREHSFGEASYYKFSVGFVDGVIGAFNVQGQGDTWEQAFKAADDAKAKDAERYAKLRQAAAQ